MVIKNWKGMLGAVFFASIFMSLGVWQLGRAHEKYKLIQSFEDRTKKAPLLTNELSKKQDQRFFKANLQGTFDNRHTLLLDNKIVEGKVGYEVYTPFHAVGLSAPILVDRGFLPMGKDRHHLPRINAIMGHTRLTGMLNEPPAYFSFGKMVDKENTWPLRVEYINLSQLSALFHTPLYPSILMIAPAHEASYQSNWRIVTLPPERHKGYALQWFALALTLLILSVILNHRSAKSPSDHG